MINALEAFERLKAGKRGFIAGHCHWSASPDRDDRIELARKQALFAVIPACSDSRVPVELIFQQGFGNLFVIRVAGNIAAPPHIGSVEFALTRSGFWPHRLWRGQGHPQHGLESW